MKFYSLQVVFVLATSTGTIEGLKNRIGGLCRTKNMRVRISVIPKLTNSIKQQSKGLLYATNLFHDQYLFTETNDQSNIIDNSPIDNNDDHYRLPFINSINTNLPNDIYPNNNQLHNSIESPVIDRSFNRPDWRYTSESTQFNDGNGRYVSENTIELQSIHVGDSSSDDDDVSLIYRHNFNLPREYRQREFDDELIDGRDYSIGYELSPYDSYGK